MDGALLSYGLDILFSGAALFLFASLWWRGKLDWSEEPNQTLWMEEKDGN